MVQLAGGASVEVMPGALFTTATVPTAAPNLFATAMTLAATTVPSVNPNPVARSITISGGTVTAISISGGSSVGTSGTFTVPVGGTIAVTYSVAPTFTDADPVPAAGTYPFVSALQAGYLASYANGPQVS